MMNIHRRDVSHQKCPKGSHSSDLYGSCVVRKCTYLNTSEVLKRCAYRYSKDQSQCDVGVYDRFTMCRTHTPLRLGARDFPTPSHSVEL